MRPVLDEDAGLAAEQSVFPLHRSPPELLMSVSTEDTESRHFMLKSALETGDLRWSVPPSPEAAVSA